jgi:beta-galactosidase/beta-glucuronidase
MVEAILTDAAGETVAIAKSAEGKIAFTVEAPHLWSTDDPYLYTLSYGVFDGATLSDGGEIKVGFKDFFS